MNKKKKNSRGPKREPQGVVPDETETRFLQLDEGVWTTTVEENCNAFRNDFRLRLRRIRTTLSEKSKRVEKTKTISWVREKARFTVSAGLWRPCVSCRWRWWPKMRRGRRDSRRPLWTTGRRPPTSAAGRRRTPRCRRRGRQSAVGPRPTARSGTSPWCRPVWASATASWPTAWTARGAGTAPDVSASVVPAASSWAWPPAAVAPAATSSARRSTWSSRNTRAPRTGRSCRLTSVR